MLLGTCGGVPSSSSSSPSAHALVIARGRPRARWLHALMTLHCMEEHKCCPQHDTSPALHSPAQQAQRCTVHHLRISRLGPQSHHSASQAPRAHHHGGVDALASQRVHVARGVADDEQVIVVGAGNALRAQAERGPPPSCAPPWRRGPTALEMKGSLLSAPSCSRFRSASCARMVRQHLS